MLTNCQEDLYEINQENQDGRKSKHRILEGVESAEKKNQLIVT